MGTYIGPERRKAQRRDPQSFTHRELGGQRERRLRPERRQEALAGVMVGLTAEDMLYLAEVWGAVERGRDREAFEQ